MDVDKTWQNIREYHLKKLDTALKNGEVDSGIVPLLHELNDIPYYVTRSSCYGRVSFSIEHGMIRKGKGKLIARFHRPISFPELEYVRSKVSNGILWMNIEGTIVHVGSVDMKYAEELLEMALKAGYLYSSIYSYSNRGVTVEILFDRKYSIPVYTNALGYLLDRDEIESLFSYIKSRFDKIEKSKHMLIKLLREYKTYGN